MKKLCQMVKKQKRIKRHKNNSAKRKVHKKQSKNNLWNNCFKTKKSLFICTIVFLVLVVILTIIIVNSVNNSKLIEPDIGYIDYNQKVTSENDEEFDSNYKTGSNKDFSVRFPELQCEEECDNIGTVRLGNDILQKDKDYIVKKGSVIIVLLAKAMNRFDTGNYSLTFEYTINNIKTIIGVKISIVSTSANDTSSNEEDKNEDNATATTDTTTAQETKPNETNGSSSGNNNSSEAPTPEPQQVIPEKYSDEWFNACPKDEWWEGNQIQYRVCARVPDPHRLGWTRSESNDNVVKGTFVNRWGYAKEHNMTQILLPEFFLFDVGDSYGQIHVPDGLFPQSIEGQYLVQYWGSYQNGRWSVTGEIKYQSCLGEKCYEPIILNAEQTAFVDNLTQIGENYLNELEASFNYYSAFPYNH
ncbi:hypothetical protein J6V85_01625 [Candidatus Saccharibacteria bacterium]|nr:hypothetical protein [Candidatus Saccharibacteria bacterium]